MRFTFYYARASTPFNVIIRESIAAGRYRGTYMYIRAHVETSSGIRSPYRTYSQYARDTPLSVAFYSARDLPKFSLSLIFFSFPSSSYSYSRICTHNARIETVRCMILVSSSQALSVRVYLFA